MPKRRGIPVSVDQAHKIAKTRKIDDIFLISNFLKEKPKIIKRTVYIEEVSLLDTLSNLKLIDKQASVNSSAPSKKKIVQPIPKKAKESEDNSNHLDNCIISF